ncbi:MAG: 3-hydroxyacyl-CoA dehydrogenase NAD-binding domain-containing protein [Lautropia sp.]
MNASAIPTSPAPAPAPAPARHRAGVAPLAFLADRVLELGPAVTPAADGGHWRFAVDDERVGWLVLDVRDGHGARANVLGEAVIDELGRRLAAIDPGKLIAMVIRSARSAGFAAGADVGEMHGADAVAHEAIVARLERGHAVLDALERFRPPTIAVIHGAALGAGLELALACDYRIAVDGARVGFPEVRLGLHPGFGGSARLTALIDPLEAMRLMLDGRPAWTEKARELGIVDVVTEERHVREAVRAIVAGRVDARSARPAGLKSATFHLKSARTVAAHRMRAQADEKAPGVHYPAPGALIELWERHGGDVDAMRRAEVDSFARLVRTPAAQNLIRVFLLRERLRSTAGAARAACGDAAIRSVHVIGAGAMGREIAAWCAVHGMRTSVTDVDTVAIGGAVAAATRLCVARHLDAVAAREALDRLVPDPKAHGLASADLVIEAVPEQQALKAKALQAAEARMKPGAILASNTSSLPLDALSRKLDSPARLAGLHFFAPVARMPLVEVARHAGTDDAVVGRLLAFCGDIDKLGVEVSPAPGYLVNRVLTPYLLEAVTMLDEGVVRERIDRVAVGFGLPVGPLELADRVGLDVCVAVADGLAGSGGRASVPIPRWLRSAIDAGHLGRKTGTGLYRWGEDGEPVSGAPGVAEDVAVDADAPAGGDADVADRLVLRMLDACADALHRGVVADADTLDAAMVFGAGFPPFRGGPIRHARAVGVETLESRMVALARRHGPRFEPGPGWTAIA